MSLNKEGYRQSRAKCWLAFALSLAYAIIAIFRFDSSTLPPPPPPPRVAKGDAASHGRKRRATFVPFPHRALPSGEGAQCRWVAGEMARPEFDAIQNASYAEGMCRYNDSSSPPLHVFSTAEAIECLSPTAQGLNVSVVISGDSYTRQLFVGLADVLLGRPSNEEIRNQTFRLETVEQSNDELASRHRNDPSFPNVQFPTECFWICYGSGPPTNPFSVKCSRCINEFTRRSDHSVAVVGAGVHVLGAAKKRLDVNFKPEEAVEGDVAMKAVDMAVGDIESFLGLAHHTTYVSMCSYQTEKVPLPYRNATHNSAAGVIYEGLLPYLAPRNESHPFIDVFQLTRACHMDNCSYDGGHRSRYVNRWKAQLLLNTLCDVG
mmetsp:Transcript_31485/g.75210  ORF Transcript_31485/g.75210 Transcript_31485/m.75210 type:complete len:376 (-) Transcript_31485:251-1378(-)